MSGYLLHYGVKGMKWGVHREMAKSASSEFNQDKRKKKKRLNDVQPLSDKWGVRREMAKSVSSGFSQAKELAAKVPDKRKEEEKKRRLNEARSLSDSDLRNRINRIQMERQYAQLTAEDSRRGLNVVQALEISGSLAALTSSIFGIVEGVKKLKGE